jgi:nitroreductase
MEEKPLTDRARAAVPSPSSLQFLFRSRRSVRRYKKKPISQKDMDKILEAGMYAPTGLNLQNVRYLVLTNQDNIEHLRQIAMPAIFRLFNTAVRVSKIPVLGDRMLGENAAENFEGHYLPGLLAIDEALKKGERDMLFHEAPAIMLVHGEKLDDMAFSCAAALFSCMLMAETLGIGCCLNGFLVLAANYDRKVKRWLGIPRNHKVHGAITLGYMNMKFNRLVKRNPAKVRYL